MRVVLQELVTNGWKDSFTYIHTMVSASRMECILQQEAVLAIRLRLVNVSAGRLSERVQRSGLFRQS